jgi:hypothetical protein
LASVRVWSPVFSLSVMTPVPASSPYFSPN